MESTARVLIKAATWQATGLISMSLLGYLISGSFTSAGQFALGSAAIGFVTFFVHEKLWARVRWGRSLRRKEARWDV